MNSKLNFHKPLLLYFLLLLSGVAYYFLAYKTTRENFLQVISLFTFLFTAYLAVYRFFSNTHFAYLLFAGIAFRILLLFSIPNLSDDVYRFIWDGRLSANGINPFSHLPAEFMQLPPVSGLTKELYVKLNSPGYYAIYPPVLQGVFWITAKLFPHNIVEAIVFMKCIIMIVEIGTLFLLIQLLKKLTLPIHFSLLYFLNPLVITELTGNVHFDGLMIFFVLLAFLLLLQSKWQSSAIFLGVGIATKLIPMLFVPFLVNKLGWKKGLLYAIITMMTTFVLFALIMDVTTLQHLLKSADLFIRRFEFNASLYYLIRWMGTIITGYNIIAFAGPVLMLAATCIIFIASFRDKIKYGRRSLVMALGIITTWYVCATTVHPWYICLPVALVVCTPYRYAIIWSFTAVVSYSAYQSNPAQENLWWVGLGYFIMIGYAFWEWKNNNKKWISQAPFHSEN